MYFLYFVFLYFLYFEHVFDVVVKSSRTLSHLLMSSINQFY